jgi:hypothetical protein
MRPNNLSIWLKACEQEVLEVAARIETIRKKLLQATTQEGSGSGNHKPLHTALQSEIINLRLIGQRINFKNTQIVKDEVSLNKNGSSRSY